MCIYSCVTLSTTLLIHAVPFNERSACDASMFTSCIYIHRSPNKRCTWYYTYYDDSMCSRLLGDLWYIFLRLASKCLNCTRSPEEMVQKLHKYDWKHKINTLKVNSDNFTKLPATFLGENNNENQVKFAKFFNILLNFSLWLCVVQVAWHNFKRFSRLTDDDKMSLAFEIFPALNTIFVPFLQGYVCNLGIYLPTLGKYIYMM